MARRHTLCGGTIYSSAEKPFKFKLRLVQIRKLLIWVEFFHPHFHYFLIHRMLREELENGWKYMLYTQKSLEGMLFHVFYRFFFLLTHLLFFFCRLCSLSLGFIIFFFWGYRRRDNRRTVLLKNMVV